MLISEELNKLKIGCVVGHEILNHVFYADDFILLCPSISGLQRLINVCADVGSSLDMLFNVTKTEVMVFKSKRDINYQFAHAVK